MKQRDYNDGLSSSVLGIAFCALFVSLMASTTHAQSSNVNPTKDIYSLKEIIATPPTPNELKLQLDTSFGPKRTEQDTPGTKPDGSGSSWSADKGGPEFDPSTGASVMLDFTNPFTKDPSASAKKVTITATYSGSSYVEDWQSTTTRDLVYLDFWIAETEDQNDDVLIVRPQGSQLGANDKKVIHWSKVVVKHSLSGSLPLNLTSTGAQQLYFYGNSNDPNQLSSDPTLDTELTKDFAADAWFWIGTDAQGSGQGKFKATGDLGSGYKDAPEEKAVNLLPVEVNEVSFNGTKYWELKSDDAATTYSAPQWKDVDGNGKPTNTAQGERDYAVAFTRNTKPKIGAKFKIASASNFGAIKIKATGSGGVAIPETAATVSGDDVTLPLTEASSTLVNTIKFYDKKDDAKAFKLEWEVKIGNSDWSKIGATKHTVYVLLADPITFLRQETLADLGCRNANDESAEASSMDKMYAEFTDRVVKRLDGKQMTYWLNNQMGCTDTADLLSRVNGNGNCQSWSGLFRDVLRLQGIQADRIRVWPQANDTFVAVKTWTFTEPPHGPVNHPYVVGIDATDAQGVPGQGNPNPPGSFNGHWITESGGTYFDPSYGAAAVSGANKGKLYEDGTFAGFGATYQLPNNGGQFDGIRKNITSAQSPAEVDYFEAN